MNFIVLLVVEIKREGKKKKKISQFMCVRLKFMSSKL